jgi:hypothetical protein
MSSGIVADGSVACAKTPTTLYEQAAGPEPTPQTSSWTARKARNNSGKKNSTTTTGRSTVSKRSQRSGVMNRRSASRDESPSRRRRPSFDTTSSATCSPFGLDDQRAHDAGAAPTYSDNPGDMSSATPLRPAWPSRSRRGSHVISYLDGASTSPAEGVSGSHSVLPSRPGCAV